MTVWIILLLVNLYAPNNLHIQEGIASVYYPGDRFTAIKSWRADGKRFKKTDFHIAHRTIPLGTKVLVVNVLNQRSVITHVRDRGTYGFCLWTKWKKNQRRCPLYPHVFRRGTKCPPGYKWVIRVRRKKKECGYYRAITDLTVPVAKKLGIYKLTPVRIYWKSK